MRAVRTHAPERLQVRSCLRCGYRGVELQGDRLEGYLLCPGCGEDLCSRPPRSYAELEGLDEGFAWTGWAAISREPGPIRRCARRCIRWFVRAFFKRSAR